MTSWVAKTVWECVRALVQVAGGWMMESIHNVQIRACESNQNHISYYGYLGDMFSTFTTRPLLTKEAELQCQFKQLGFQQGDIMVQCLNTVDMPSPLRNHYPDPEVSNIQALVYPGGQSGRESSESVEGRSTIHATWVIYVYLKCSQTVSCSDREH